MAKRTRKRISRTLRAKVIAAAQTCDGGICCALCGKRLSRAAVTLDHIVRVADGGRNTFLNLRVACAPCNNMRHDAPSTDTTSFIEKLTAQKQDEDRAK